ncbi:YhgE/Pip domain-containing protein [Neobacillus sp. PS3-12]|uniref:YhgE/Pip domain-containing protein n=1 Tax=Neobacillus sp. PS3-12 TaxID=3070677 RepID=UPI0027E0328F|nr:YhgE/Pip domain-containing protein [Neobacillus sp. PS3-12]WML55609.1 YhgE/Pip domain-containing protein [Neobacillus sp. PS3-12]
MGIFTSLKNELLGILHNRKLLIAVIGVMTVPLLYSGTYLWAFWDPYGHLDRLPVAVVNNDQGAVYDGSKLEIGKDLVKELKKKESFQWKFVSEKEADKGLKNQNYYIKIEIPKDFSEDATTLQSENPKKLTLIYTPNEGYNYLSSKIGDSAIEKIKEEVSSSVTKTYAKSMLQNIKDVANGLAKAGDGAASLNDGTVQVDSGAKKLEENLKTLATKSVAFSEGTVSAQTGSKQLQDGLNQFGTGLGQMKDGTSELLTGAQKSKEGATQLSNGLADAEAKMPDLQNGSKQLTDGTAQLTSGMEQWKQGAAVTKSGAESLNQGLQQTADQVSQMAAATTDETQKAQLEALQKTLDRLTTGSKAVADGVGKLSGTADVLEQSSEKLSAGASQLNAGQDQLAGGINQLASGAKDLAVGQTKLTTGLSTLNDKIGLAMNGFSGITSGSSSLTSGLNQLAAGSAQFQSGTSQLANGSSDLESGVNKLSAGSMELKDQLQSGAKDASGVKANNSVYDMFSKPVSLKTSRLNQVPDYGTGFAPYFLSLSLFVGALVLSVIFPMFVPAGEPKSSFGWFAGKLGVILIVGLAQALLADVILLKVLGLEVKSVPFFIMLSIFTSWTFFAIIQFLVTVLENPGRFLAIIILVLQLTSSAGTYPIELSPSLLQTINHFMPMTYAVAGFRAIISTGDFNFMWRNIGFESIFFIGFLVLTLTFFLTRFKKKVQPQF